MNLLERIQVAMIADDGDPAKQSDYLKRTYKLATGYEKAILNEAFIALCGWSLRTLIEQDEAQFRLNEEPKP